MFTNSYTCPKFYLITCFAGLVKECKASYLKVTGSVPPHISMGLRLIKLCLTNPLPPLPSESNSQIISDNNCFPFYLLILLW